MKWFISFLMCSFLAACGGGGGGGNSTPVENEPDPIDNGGNNPDPTLEPQPTPTPVTQSGETYITVAGAGSNKTVTIEGKTYTLTEIERLYEQPVYAPIANVYPVGFQGSAVEGYAIAIYNANNPALSSAGYRFYGTATQPPALNFAVYRGYYALVRGVEDPWQASVTTRMIIELDMNANTIYGESYPAEGLVIVDGVIVNDAIEATIHDSAGSHYARGNFYGANGYELAIGYDSGSISGILYGYYDERLTENRN